MSVSMGKTTSPAIVHVANAEPTSERTTEQLSSDKFGILFHENFLKSTVGDDNNEDNIYTNTDRMKDEENLNKPLISLPLLKGINQKNQTTERGKNKIKRLNERILKKKKIDATVSNTAKSLKVPSI